MNFDLNVFLTGIAISCNLNMIERIDLLRQRFVGHSRSFMTCLAATTHLTFNKLHDAGAP